MKWFITIILLSCSVSALLAQDLFGDPKEIQEQKELYLEFFGKEDEKAKSESKRLVLAAKLLEKSQEADYKPMQKYLYRRVGELCEGAKKFEAYRIRISLHDLLYKNDRSKDAELNTLMQEAWDKADKEHKVQYAKQIASFINADAEAALEANDYAEAEEQYKSLSDWLKKALDSDGSKAAKSLAKKISKVAKEFDRIIADQEKAKTDPGNVKLNEKVGAFYFAHKKWELAESYLINAKSTLAPMASAAKGLDASAEQARLILKTVPELIKKERDDDIKHSLLNLGLQALVVIEADKETSDLMKLKYKKSAEEWPDELERCKTDALERIVLSAGGGDETRYLRLGWEPLFDHKALPGKPNYNKAGSKMDKEDYVLLGGGRYIDLDVGVSEVVVLFEFHDMSKSQRVYFELIDSQDESKGKRCTFWPNGQMKVHAGMNGEEKKSINFNKEDKHSVRYMHNAKKKTLSVFYNDIELATFDDVPDMKSIGTVDIAGQKGDVPISTRIKAVLVK